MSVMTEGHTSGQQRLSQERSLDLLRAVRLSVLDRSLIRRGQRPGEAVRDTVAFAQQIEAMGYHRFWVSEHHGVPGVAGSAPTVLASAVASATSRIRVGTAGVMLPNHQPLVVAEQFGVLEALFPGRIDMGLGRSVGFTGEVRAALGAGREAAEEFPGQIAELLGYFEGTRRVRALPAEGLYVPAFVLATGAGARVAAELGLPLVVGGPAQDKVRAAAAHYREAYRPTARHPTPYVVVAVSTAVAESAQEAELLQLPEAWATVESRTKGVFTPLVPASEVLSRDLNDREERYLRQARQSQIRGTRTAVAGALGELIAATQADELLLTLNTHDPEDKLTSYGLLAELTTPSAIPSSTRS